jgi:hypothetical protein
MDIWPTGTTKGSKSIIIWYNLEKTLTWGFRFDDFAKKKVYKKGGSKKGLILVF